MPASFPPLNQLTKFVNLCLDLVSTDGQTDDVRVEFFIFMKESKNMSLAGKIAIVTGGTGALGSAIVRRFLDEAIKVIVSHRNPKELGGFPDSVRSRISFAQCDVTIESDVQRLFETAIRTVGTVNILVNTVGGYVPRKLVPDVTIEEWDRMMNINLKSTFLCSREALRRMKGEKYGRIINISAMVGLHPSPGRSAYAISKSAVSLFTEIVGEEQKGSGITINAIAPSIIDSSANRHSMPDEDFSRWVKPESIADIICYLCSDAATDVTGTTIKAFGGL
jgi:NAD(P)-dependent dehydrogenase (short-subunit alcohol dehydrogenase family)